MDERLKVHSSNRLIKPTVYSLRSQASAYRQR